MSVPPQWKECSWTESSDSNGSSDDDQPQINNLGVYPPSQARLRARRGPIIPVEMEEIEDSRDFWKNCFIGVLLDIRRYSVGAVQRIINRASRLRDRVTVVGRANNNYVLHFNDSNDLFFIWPNGLWSLEGAFMTVDVQRPNTILSEVNLPLIPIWVQLWGLPLEYQVSKMARRIAKIIGPVSQVDWMDSMPRNLRFMRVRVWIELIAPLIAGCMLHQDDSVMTWIEFRYEKVHKICRRCGIIGHTTPHCPQLNPEIERMIEFQMENINKRFAFDTGYDFQNVLFTNNIRAFHHKSTRRTTGIETIIRRKSQQEVPANNQAPQTPEVWHVDSSDEDDENSKEMYTEGNQAGSEPPLQAEPLEVRFSEEMHQEWERQQVH